MPDPELPLLLLNSFICSSWIMPARVRGMTQLRTLEMGESYHESAQVVNDLTDLSNGQVPDIGAVIPVAAVPRLMVDLQASAG